MVFEESLVLLLLLLILLLLLLLVVVEVVIAVTEGRATTVTTGAALRRAVAVVVGGGALDAGLLSGKGVGCRSVVQTSTITGVDVGTSVVVEVVLMGVEGVGAAFTVRLTGATDGTTVAATNAGPSTRTGVEVGMKDDDITAATLRFCTCRSRRTLLLGMVTALLVPSSFDAADAVTDNMSKKAVEVVNIFIVVNLIFTCCVYSVCCFRFVLQ